MDCCAEQYRCLNALYLLSILAHAYNIIFGYGVGATGHGIEVVDGLNDTGGKYFNVNNNCSTEWCSRL